ncbi:Protein of unknown function [Roseivivax lentus]|uniref:DUF2796 domain-containing protein n=1 Tax=Roseivivax lentus TaxID=633194 RepID=A0A1N7NAT1_9RHOB|nr:DUF2796 domain-containing protein [Roseivivax lentus]SIS95358.1 Protein of unknown function [Roseivivax lentus]
MALLLAAPALADDTRQLDAHEHGVGTLDMALDGETIVIAFQAPGSDIVGFEYAARSDADVAAVDAAKKALGDPLALFGLPDAAGCEVEDAKVEVEGGEHGDDHAGHDDDGHRDETGHTEFHAAYEITCSNPDRIDALTFFYFDVFANAREVEVQIIDPTGARAFEVDRDRPVLDLGR